MTMKCRRVLQFSVAVWLGALSVGTAWAQDPWQINERKVEEQKLVEKLRDMALKEAQAAEDIELKQVMKVVRADPQRLVLTQGLQGRQPKARGFSVVLLLGDLQGTSDTPDNVPEAARKALADMKDFLPYKSYRLLDAAWILGSGQLRSVLKGLDDRPYSLELTSSRGLQIPARPSPTGLLQMSVRLDEIDGTLASSEESLSKTAAELNSKLAALRETYTDGHPMLRAVQGQLSDVNRQIELRKLRGTPGTGRPVVATSFSMDVGETVVVGTSRVQGDKALILLLTAVPQGK